MNEVEYFEKMLLAKAIKYPEQRDKLRLLPEHFSNDKHSEIYKLITNDNKITQDDVMTAAVKEPKKYGSYDVVNDIVNFPIATKHGIDNDQYEIFSDYKQRLTLQLVTEYMNDQSEERSNIMMREIQSLNDFDIKGTDTKEDTLTDILDDLHGINEQTILRSGFRELDNIISGFEMQQLNVIGARPSAGKTAFALGTSVNLSRGGAEVTFCSLETTEKNITQRLLSSLSKVDLHKFKNPIERMNTSEIERVQSAMEEYADLNLKVEASGSLTPDELRRIINKMDSDKPCFVVIDYLQLMSSDVKHNSKYEEVSHISRELKKIVQEMEHVTIIALSQLSRSVESRNDKRPMMSDLRESGQIEQDSNMIMMLYRDDYYNPPEEIKIGAPSPLEVIVAKNKDGGLGTAELDFYKETQQIF